MIQLTRCKVQSHAAHKIRHSGLKCGVRTDIRQSKACDLAHRPEKAASQKAVVVVVLNGVIVELAVQPELIQMTTDRLLQELTPLGHAFNLPCIIAAFLLTDSKAQYTPPTPTRRNCRVASRRRCVHEFATSSRRLSTDSVM